MYTEGISLLILTIITALYLLIIQSLNLVPEVSVFNSDLLKQKPKHRLSFFDFAKGLAIVAVLLIHVVFLINFYSEDFSSLFLEFSQHINRLMRFAIAVFFISSGALLFLEDFKKETLKKFYFTKIKRLILPYAFLSFFSTYISSTEFNGFFDYLTTAVVQFFTGTALVPYWFIPVLFQLYLIYPLLWYLLVIKKINPTKILGMSFIFSLVSYFLFSSYFLKWHSYIGGLTFFGGYLFFFTLGIVFKPFFLENKEKIMYWFNKTKFFYFLALVVSVYLFIGFLDPLFEYYNVRLIYGPIVMFLIFYVYQFIKNTQISKTFEKIGKQSLYIYLLHFIFLLVLFPLAHFLAVMKINPVVIFITIFIFNFSATYLFVLLIQKIFKLIK